MGYALFDRFAAPVTSFMFFATIAAFIVITFILDYHWRHYSTSAMRLKMLRRTYLGVSFFLIVVMAGAFLSLFS